MEEEFRGRRGGRGRRGRHFRHRGWPYRPFYGYGVGYPYYYTRPVYNIQVEQPQVASPLPVKPAQTVPMWVWVLIAALVLAVLYFVFTRQ